MKRTRSHIFCLLLCLTLLAVLLPGVFSLSTEAAEIVNSGTCGENLTWTLDDEGTLIISGTGEMKDYEDDDCNIFPRPWGTDIKKAVIQEGVTSIGASAFYKCSKLTSVTLPDSLTKINFNAFLRCSKLTDITLPDSLTSIGYSAFSACTSLTKIILPEGLTSTGGAAFSGCKSLTNVTLPDSLTTINHLEFYNCSSLTSIILPDSLTEIDLWAFEKCSSLTSITFPAGLTKIGMEAFYRCTSLREVYFLGDVPEFGSEAFQSVTATMYYPANNSTWDDFAKWTYGGALTWKAWTPAPAEPVVKISGNADTGKPVIRWEAAQGADLYRVYRATSKTGTYSRVKSTSSLSYTDTTAKPGTNYYYKVKAVDSGSDAVSGYSNIVNRVCDLAKPDMTLKADTASGKPKLTWNAVSGAAKYRIYRATSKSGEYKLVKTTTSRSYIDTTAEAGTNYYYKVKAAHTKSSADSAYSEIVNRVCDLAKPVVTVKLTSGGDPRITWKTVEGAEKYYVYRATSKDGTYTKVKATVTSRAYTDTTATAGKTYYYKVKAIHDNTSANSAYSSVKYITAK